MDERSKEQWRKLMGLLFESLDDMQVKGQYRVFQYYTTTGNTDTTPVHADPVAPKVEVPVPSDLKVSKSDVDQMLFESLGYVPDEKGE